MTPYWHTIHMERGQKHHKLTFSIENAFGMLCRYYSAEYRVTTERLYTDAEVNEHIRKALIADRRSIVKHIRSKSFDGCELGSNDPETGIFECSKLENGECNCFEYGELADEIEKRPLP